MTEDERRHIMRRLVLLVRQMGWEDLLDVPIGPEVSGRDTDAAFDPGRARDLVAQVAKLVQDLASVELELLFSADGVETVSFKPDLGADERRFEHSLRIDRQQFEGRRHAFAATLKALRTLEGRFDDAD